MIQISAYKLLYVGRDTILKATEGVKTEQQWLTKLPATMSESFNWVLGHYAAVEDWYLHHLNGVPYQLSDSWQKTYWADTSGKNLTPENAASTEEVIHNFKATRKRLLDALIWDLFHLNRCVKKGFFPGNVKTRGDAWLFISAHAYWHIGQLNTLRGEMGLPYQGSKGIHH